MKYAHMESQFAKDITAWFVEELKKAGYGSGAGAIVASFPDWGLGETVHSIKPRLLEFAKKVSSP